MNATTIKTRIVRIGNSHGVRLPKLLLDQLHLGPEVEVAAEQDHLIIRPVGRPRQDWEAHFQRMAKLGDDRLLDAEAISLRTWDKAEWTW